MQAQQTQDTIHHLTPHHGFNEPMPDAPVGIVVSSHQMFRKAMDKAVNNDLTCTRTERARMHQDEQGHPLCQQFDMCRLMICTSAP